MRMIRSARTWGNADFNNILKTEIEQLDAEQLPLQAGLSHSSYVSEDAFRVMIISATEISGRIHARAGIFYSGIIAGCSCADDPTPVDTQTEYCEVQLDIDSKTGETTITLIRD